MTPAEVAEQTPSEIQTMMDGLDWVSDREWERALFLRSSGEPARDIFELNYPHYKTPRVTKIIRSDDPPPGDLDG